MVLFLLIYDPSRKKEIKANYKLVPCLATLIFKALSRYHYFSRLGIIYRASTGFCLFILQCPKPHGGKEKPRKDGQRQAA